MKKTTKTKAKDKSTNATKMTCDCGSGKKSEARCTTNSGSCSGCC